MQNALTVPLPTQNAGNLAGTDSADMAANFPLWISDRRDLGLRPVLCPFVRCAHAHPWCRCSSRSFIRSLPALSREQQTDKQRDKQRLRGVC
jgi:hypothetical protein